jgi:23S rRNA (uracil1939-C5)-methyltransferase
MYGKEMIPVEKNKEYITEITAVSSDGNGICKIDGYAVFVPQTVTGDTVRILIVKVNKGYGYGKLLEVIKPSPYRCDPVCGAYKRCGGCQLMHMDYAYQLKVKADIIESAMQRIGGFSDFKLSEMVGAKNPYRYRNKMIFPVGENKNGEIICGFYAQRSHDIMPLDDCYAGGAFNAGIIDAVKSYMSENGVSAYNEKTHTGLIRRIFTRVSHTKGHIMVVISANGKNLPQKDDLISKLRNVSDNITGIILNINTKKTNLVLGSKNITLWGNDTITDSLMGLDFKISPHSFYQINPVMTEKLYTKAIEYAALTGSENVMDIYCGIGTISLCAAKRAKHVTGVEIVERAICDAKENADINGIKNVDFYASSAEDIVPVLIEKGERPDVVILDPPRKGSDEKTLIAIVKAKPKRIVYVSCNPATLARDAKFLNENGYELTFACGFDMFPNTMHVECVVLMSRIKD